MAEGDTCHVELQTNDVEKTKISEELGHYALFLDNAGNRLGLWSR